MRGLWLFLHISGIVMWLGAGMASMIARGLILPGSFAAWFSGFALAGPMMANGGMAGLPQWVHIMMGAGTLGAVLVWFVSVPTASKLGRLELDARGELPESFPRLRKRQVIGASIAGGMGILAVIAGTFLRA
jgi:hypothetical protein